MNSKTLLWRRTRAATWIALLLLVVLIPAACQSTQDNAGNAGNADVAPADNGESEAVAEAGDEFVPPTLDSDAMRESAFVALTAVVETATAAVATPEPGDDGSAAGGSSPELQEPGSSDSEQSALDRVREQQATSDAEENIADVNDLVLQMVPMATFTPDPSGPHVSGDLVYLRNGRFFTIDAASEVRNELGLDDSDMPRVWSPPNDPGRAWTSPDGTHMAFFAGPDAEMWVSGVDGSDNHALSASNLPTDKHELGAGGDSQTVRLRPGQDHTLVFLPESEKPFSVLIDDNSRHIKGQARLRVVHAAGAEADRALVAFVNGTPFDSSMAYGQGTGNRAIVSGPVEMDLRDIGGQPIVQMPVFDAAEKELKTVFVVGDDELGAMQYSYEPSEAPSGNSRVRVFNAGSDDLDVQLDGETLVRGVAAHTLSDYVNVPAVYGTDERKDAELALYSLRTGENQIDWSGDGQNLAYVGSPDGQMDVYVSSLDGPAKRVSDDQWREVNPRWSPDGEHLVYESLDERLADHHVGVLLAGASEPFFVDLAPIRAKLGWEPGTTIVFPKPIDWAGDDLIYMYPKSDKGAGGIWVYDVEAGALSQLYNGSILGPDYSLEAGAWAFGSPDGELYTMTQGGDVRTLPVQDGFHPIWSPDGETISWVEGDPLSETGWRIHAMDADGSNDRALTDWLPVLQAEPPVPGPNAKRYWLDGGETLAFTRAGRDYGAADRAGGFGSIEAGDDIENYWIVPTDGGEPPTQATDLVKVFYLKEPIESEDGDTIGLVGFSYRDRVQQLWTVPEDGGTPVKIDGPVRWFAWLQ